MPKLKLSVLVLFMSCAVASILAHADDDPEHRRSIVAITICSSSGVGLHPNPGCEDGTADTEQIVRGIGQESINEDGLRSTTDEHSSVFPPGYLGDNEDYLFFVASGYEGVNPDIGMMVLSGVGPDENGQWALHLADGYGDYGAQGRGTVFLSPTSQGRCPNATDNDPANQDQTFDLAYAAPGSLFQDPTSQIRRLLMIYEGTNACVGSSGGRKPDTGAYESIGVATSLDHGRSWPRYASNATFESFDLPFASQTQGPKEPFGAMGSLVCMGNDCLSPVPSTYGRYQVLRPPVPLDDTLMQDNALGGLGENVANAQPSAFLDDVRHGAGHGDDNADGLPFVYVVYEYVPGLLRVSPPKYQLPQGRNKDVMVARARLDPDGNPLTFFKWDGSSFGDPGLGGLGSGVLQTSDTAFEHCADPAQERSQASISYVEETQQYLLTFVCSSPGAPHDGVNDSSKQGSVWFFSTTDDLSDQSRWSVPQEIIGSWAEWTHHDVLPAEARCPVFNGFYPTFMSLGHAPGHLSTHGYVFYLTGSLGACQNDQAPGLPPRQYTSRQFRIITGFR